MWTTHCELRVLHTGEYLPLCVFLAHDALFFPLLVYFVNIRYTMYTFAVISSVQTESGAENNSQQNGRGIPANI